MLEKPVLKRIATDSVLRTIVFAIPGFVTEAWYAVFNGVVSLIEGSAWYGSLAAYYLLMALMRIFVVSNVRGNLGEKEAAMNEIKAYSKCGWFLIFTSIALGGVVIMIVSEGNGKTYHGLIIYAVALYTFFKITLSILNMAKARKMKSPRLMAQRNINWASALMSLLSLQTAMINEFNEGKTMMVMNLATGIAICTIVCTIGIHDVVNARRLRRELQ